MKRNPAILEAEIGRRIKALRTGKRITLEHLARQTGFTKGYLSKVEKSKKAPPVSTLGNIARAFNVTISSLLGEDSPRTSLCLVRKGERPVIARDGTAFEYSYEAMAHNYPNKNMEPFILTLPVGPKKKTFYQHEGDCVYFDSGIPHFGESIGPKEAKCFMVICNPTYIRERKTHAT